MLADRTIWRAWWPLAASWLLMGVELPAVSAVMARLAEPNVHLAAYGGIVFPLALVIEAPVIMLLSTSTALSRDWPSYLLLRRFTHVLGAALTAVHAALAFTPLFDLVATTLLRAPPEILGPGRLGMQIMLPWTWTIASRRFQQGVLIRFGRSGAVGVGTLVRLIANLAVLGAGFAHGGFPGIVVAAAATATGVTAEALYVAVRVQPVLRQHLRPAAPVEPPLRLRALVAFHTPLALTSLLHLATLPLGSAAMGRMPLTLASLAAWPVVTGLVFLFKGVGLAYTEVVVVLLDRPDAVGPLRQFARRLAVATSVLLAAVAATPLAGLWLVRVSHLHPDIADLAHAGLLLSCALPAITVMQSWRQGILVHGKATRAVSEAVVVALLATGALLAAGIALGYVTGLYVAVVAGAAGAVAQLAWLWWRGRPLLARRGAEAPLPAASLQPASSD